MSKRDTSFLLFGLEYSNKNISTIEIKKIYDSIFFSFKPDFTKNDKDLSKYSYFLSGVGIEVSNSLQIFCRYREDLWVCSKEKRSKQYSWQDLRQKNIKKSQKPLILIYYL